MFKLLSFFSHVLMTCMFMYRFVSAIHIPSFSQSTLISGGGDPELKVWDWLSGKILNEVPILETIEPFIKVKPPKSKGWGIENDDDGSSNPVRRQGKGRRRKGKGKEKEQQVVEQGGNITVEDDKVEEDEVQGKTTESASVDVEMVDAEPTTTKEVEDGIEMAPELSETERKTLVMNRIDSVDRGAAGRFILFSAVG